MQHHINFCPTEICCQLIFYRRCISDNLIKNINSTYKIGHHFCIFSQIVVYCVPFNDTVSFRWATERCTTMRFYDWTAMLLLKTLWSKGTENLYFSGFFDFQTTYFLFPEVWRVFKPHWCSTWTLEKQHDAAEARCIHIKKFLPVVESKTIDSFFSQICDTPLRFMILERYITERKSCNVPIVRDGYSFVSLLALKNFLLRSS